MTNFVPKWSFKWSLARLICLLSFKRVYYTANTTGKTIDLWRYNGKKFIKIISFVLLLSVIANSQDLSGLLNPDYRVRNYTEEELYKYGKEHKQELIEKSKEVDVEGRLRIQRILRRLDEDDLWRGTNITKPLGNMKFGSVIREFGVKSNNYSSLPEDEIVFVGNGLKFKVMDDVANQLHVSTYGRGFSNGERNPKYNSYYGPFRLYIESTQRNFESALNSFGKQIGTYRQDVVIECVLCWEDTIDVLKIGNISTNIDGKEYVHYKSSSDVYSSVGIYQTGLHIPFIDRDTGIIKNLKLNIPLYIIGGFKKVSITNLNTTIETSGYKISTKTIDDTTWVNISYEENNDVDFTGRGISLLSYFNGAAINQTLTQEDGGYVSSFKNNTNIVEKIEVTFPSIYSMRIIEFSFDDISIPELK